MRTALNQAVDAESSILGATILIVIIILITIILFLILLIIMIFMIQELWGQMSNASVSPTNPIVEAAAW